MLRVALIAYLSLTTVLGPALCCCNVQQLSTLVDGPKCCGKPADRRSNVETADAIHEHGHAGHHHRHVSPKLATEAEQVPVPHKHDGEKCPCGKHHANLVAAITGSVQSVVGEIQHQTWSILVAALPVIAEFEVKTASISTHQRPADLYGREMLRAYQIMRC